MEDTHAEVTELAIAVKRVSMLQLRVQATAPHVVHHVVMCQAYQWLVWWTDL